MTIELFAADAPPTTRPKIHDPHWFTVAARKAKVPGWRWCSVEVVGEHDFLVTGGVPTGTFTKGPRKGETKWVGVVMERCVVTHAEVQAEEARFEAEEQKCHECFGDGRTPWSHGIDGTKYRSCRRCNGTGRPGHASIPECKTTPGEG